MALFRPKAEFEPALLAEAARVVDRIRREVPGVIGFFFEPNAAPDAEGWRYASLHRFVSRASYADYDRHPLHHALKDLVMARTVELATGDLDTTTAARLSRKEQ
jgi:heme-degrading monooxygenase HmoA